MNDEAEASIRAWSAARWAELQGERPLSWEMLIVGPTEPYKVDGVETAMTRDLAGGAPVLIVWCPCGWGCSSGDGPIGPAYEWANEHYSSCPHASE